VSGAHPQVSTGEPRESRGEAATGLRAFVFALFFIFGGITSLNDILIPKLKALFTLSYHDVMLVQSAFFAAYFLCSLPAAWVVRRLGYMRAAVVGLLLMTAGCLLFVPASSSGRFPTFLCALFVLAAGITVVQVVANPLISLLGPAATAHSRLTFAQAFNSLGTTVFPYVGALLILRTLAPVDVTSLSGEALSRYRIEESHVFARTYLGLAIAIAVVAVSVWLQRDRIRERRDADRSPLGHPARLLRQPRFGWGVLCIFLYVGAEVAIGSMMVSFLSQPDVLALDAEAAGKHLPLYWGGAMIGRFLGAYVLRLFAPGKVLAAAAAVVLALLAVAAGARGAMAAHALLAVGLFNSIMFPTIFSLASEGLGARAAEGSGLIATAIVGGAVVPWIMGRVADACGTLQPALAVPAVSYGVILSYGLYARRPRRDLV